MVRVALGGDEGGRSSRFIDQGELGVARRASESDGAVDLHTGPPSNVRTASVLLTTRPAGEIHEPKLEDIELSRMSDGMERSASSRKRMSKARPVSVLDARDTHGMLMLTGWEFWLLFTILSLREFSVHHRLKICLPFYIVSGTGLMCKEAC